MAEWVQKGSLMGPQGPKGDIGETGPKGDTGETGPKGDTGATGATPVISMTATVDQTTGTPSIDVSKSGSDEAPSFNLAITGIKGEKGDKGDTGPQGPKGDDATLPEGGTEGQFLKKTASGVAWADQSTVTIDSALSGTSTNPVQNKVVKAGLDSKLTTPSGGSNGQYLQKTSSGTAWATVNIPDMSNFATKDELNSLNLGGYENAKERTGVQNLNTMTTPGSYYFTSYASVTNKPSEINDNFAVDVINIANGDLVQVAYSYDSSDNKVKIFARYRDISDFVWRSWNEIGSGSKAESESGMDFESYTLDTIEGVSAVAYRMNDMVTISIHTSSLLGWSVVEQLESSFVLPESFRKKTEFETFYCGVCDFFEVNDADYISIAKVPRGLGLRILSNGKIAFRKMPENVGYGGINISIDFTYNRSI